MCKYRSAHRAGQAVQLHATANSEPKASRLPKPLADALASWSQSYAESDNPFVVMSRSVTGTIGRIFDETETAKVTKWVKEMDPTFTQESFLRELREYIVPELVDAYVNGDQPILKQWCSEAVRIRGTPSAFARGGCESFVTDRTNPPRRPTTCSSQPCRVRLALP
jgi:hypothetical protein